MKNVLVARLAPIASVLLFGLALILLHHELRGHQLHEIFAALESLPRWQILAAVGLTVLGYLTLTGYDALAVRYLGYPLKYRQVALGAFAGYAFSNTIGLSVLASIPVRCHVYAAYGLSALQVSEIVLFCALTFWLGFLTLAGVVFVIAAPPLPAILHLPFTTARPLGVVCLLLVGSYLTWTLLWRQESIRIKSWEFRLPGFGIALAQLVVSSLDWLLAAGVMYLLFPPAESLSFARFLGVFLLGQAAGLLSHVPGGLGVFETVMLLMLSPDPVSAPTLFGALMLFRIIYYVLPLLTAGLLLAGRELVRKPEVAGKLGAAVGGWGQVVVPQVLTITTFVGGAILLFSGALPAEHVRLNSLRTLVPLPVMEVSHFLGSLIGVGLLILARGIQRRLDAAYIVTAALLGLGCLFSLLKGLDYEESIALGLMLLALLPCRRYFYRKAALVNQHFTPTWAMALLVVVGASIWLGLFSYKHDKYSEEMWWQFAFNRDAPRFLRATVGVLIAMLFGGGLLLLRPTPLDGQPPTSEELAKALPITEQARDTSSYLALLGDKSLLFSDKANAFVMYAVEGRSWVAFRDPVGPAEEIPELVWEFREMCDEEGGRPVFYQVGTTYLPVYIDAGFNLLKLGEEGRVSLPEFGLEGGSRKGLRKTFNHVKKECCTFEIVPREETPRLIPELTVISDTWLATKQTREKGFSLGRFDPDYICKFPIALLRREGRIVAFANMWLGGDHDELSIDLMRYLPEAPDGAMEYLFIELMLWGKQAGYRWFNLGMAPLSGLEGRSSGRLWNRMAGLVFRHGEHFYKFQGLRRYKEKFDPVWEPKYLASLGGFALPVILTNIATLISRGIKGVLGR